MTGCSIGLLGEKILGGYRFWVVTCCMLFFACHSVFIFSSLLATWIIHIVNPILNYTRLTLYMMAFLMTLLRHRLRNMAEGWYKFWQNTHQAWGGV